MTTQSWCAPLLYDGLMLEDPRGRGGFLYCVLEPGKHIAVVHWLAVRDLLACFYTYHTYWNCRLVAADKFSKHSVQVVVVC
jgi:hypothetical protein